VKKPDYKVKLIMKTKKGIIVSEVEVVCYDFDVEEIFKTQRKKMLSKYQEDVWFTGIFEYYVFEWGNWQQSNELGKIKR